MTERTEVNRIPGGGWQVIVRDEVQPGPHTVGWLTDEELADLGTQIAEALSGQSSDVVLNSPGRVRERLLPGLRTQRLAAARTSRHGGDAA